MVIMLRLMITMAIDSGVGDDGVLRHCGGDACEHIDTAPLMMLMGARRAKIVNTLVMTLLLTCNFALVLLMTLILIPVPLSLGDNDGDMDADSEVGFALTLTAIKMMMAVADDAIVETDNKKCRSWRG